MDRRSRDSWDEISRAAHLLFPEAQAGASTNADKFWEPAARLAFNAVSALIAETPDHALNLPTVLRYFARGDGIDRLIAMIEQSCADSGGRRYSQAVVDGISDMIGGDVPQVEGIRKSVSTRLGAFFNSRIAASSRASDFDLRDLRRKPMTVYIVVNPSDMPRMLPTCGSFSRHWSAPTRT